MGERERRPPSQAESPPRAWARRPGIEALPVLAWVLVSVPAFFVLPAIDDFSTSSPLPFGWDLVLPGTFWRPIQGLIRAAVHFFPSAYPALPHALAVTGHGAAAWFLFRLCRGAGAGRGPAAIGTALFIVSPAVSAAVWSVDSAIQTWSTALGLGATWALFRSLEHQSPRWPWLAYAFGAALWKESGVAWFVAAPLLAQFLSGRCSLRQTIKPAGLGLATFAAYLLIRFALSSSLQLGGEGRYDLSLDPLALARNTAMLLGVSLSTVDTVSLFAQPRSLLLAVATGLACLPLLTLMALGLWRANIAGSCLLIAAAAIAAVLGPHAVLNHVSEMYAHPLVAVACCLGSVFAARSEIDSRFWTTAVGLFAIGAVTSASHKLISMIETGRRAATVGQRLCKALPAKPASYCVVAKLRAQKVGYSVFQAEPAVAADWGRAALGCWGWPRRPVFLVARSVGDCPSYIGHRFVMNPDGSFERLAPAPAAALK